MTRTVLVIGATGILAPAVSALRTGGDEVIPVARTGPFAVDATDADALRTALQGADWQDALVYGAAVSDASLAYVRAATTGRCVLVRTSGAADPAHGILIVPRDTLQLGWRPAGDSGDPSVRAENTPRRAPGVAHEVRMNGPWHTPDEVSAAALAVLADGEPRTLGVVRPWSDRP